MKSIKLFTVVSVIIIIAGACEVEPVKQYFEVNGSKADINYAYMDTYGVSNDLSSRYYAISFRSHELDPSDYITFFLGSFTNETDIIAIGTYVYDYLGDRGNVTDLVVGYNIGYDYLGYPTSGIRIDDSEAVYTGTVKVQRRGSSYTFIFDLQAELNNELFTITGEYTGHLLLNTGAVDLSTY